MSEPKNSGNAAEELAEHERGADFSTVNKSEAPPQIADIPVEAEFVGNDVVVRRTDKTEFRTGSIADMQESERSKLDAQIFEDPQMASLQKGLGVRPPQEWIQERDRRRMAAMEKWRGDLQFWSYNGDDTAGMTEDRVMILRDTMQSAYSCRSCEGEGHTKIVCTNCKGKKKELSGGLKGEPCRLCEVLGYDRIIKRASGFTICESCKGSGSRGGVVIPDEAKSSPISGIIVSCGPECCKYKLGDRVTFSRYSGHEMSTPDGDVYFFMHEHEVLFLCGKRGENNDVLSRIKRLLALEKP